MCALVVHRLQPHLDGKHVVFGIVEAGMEVSSRLKGAFASMQLNRPSLSITAARVPGFFWQPRFRTSCIPPTFQVVRAMESEGSSSGSVERPVVIEECSEVRVKGPARHV